MTDRLSRRRALALLALGPAGISGLIQEALAKGDLPTTPGIHTVNGTVTVNGKPAKAGTPVNPGDKVATGAASQAVVVVGKDAFLMRDRTNVVFEAAPATPGVVNSVLVATGKLLSVFDKRKPGERGISVKAAAATIGIRGTGCYLEIHDKRTYFCLCYGEAEVSGGNMAAPATIKTTHHESPVWLDESGSVMKVEKAGFVNHTDLELIMLEKLQGREPPFVAMGLTGKY